MRILMILFGFFPSDVRPRKEALTLVKKHKVTVLCCNERGAYRRFCGVGIPRLGRPQDWEGRMTPKQLIKFWFHSFIYLLAIKDFDVLHCHDLTSLPPAVLYKIISPRTKIIYDSHENYPDAVREKLGNLVGLPFLILEKFCIKFVNHVIGISLPQKELMQKRYNIKKFFYLPNFPSAAEFFFEPKRSSITFIDSDGLLKRKTVIYAGGIHRFRGYEQLVDAVEILAKNHDDFIIQLVGSGPLRNHIEDQVKSKKLTRFFDFVGEVHYTEVREYLREADIGLALYQPTTNCDYGLSNKLFEYLVCGLPIIYPYYKGSAPYLRMVKGVAVNPTKPSSIARKIEFLLDNPERRKEMRDIELDRYPEFMWEWQEPKFLDFYQNL